MDKITVTVELENPYSEGLRRTVSSVRVEGGAALSWFPATVLHSLHIKRRRQRQFRQADGSVVARWTGEANVYVGGTVTVDDVVFGEEGDPVQLGARSLMGLNLTLDPATMQLVEKGPAPAVAVGAVDGGRLSLLTA